MRKIAVITVFIAFLTIFSQHVYQVHAITHDRTKKIEPVENHEIIYCKNGTRTILVIFHEGIGFRSKPASSTHYTIYKPPIDWREIFKTLLRIVKQIAETLCELGASCFLLAWQIWNTIKTLRRGRPKDYRKIGFP